MYFTKLLIANRGEIAVRIIRACRELDIATVVVFSEADRKALHVRLADQAIPIGPAAASASYLRSPAIIEAALSSGAQAIHPGYGFLSEQAAFAQACQEAGLVFIGPPPSAMELLGSKSAAKRLAVTVGVPTVPGYVGDDQRPEVLAAHAQQIGFPLMIKASAGGGGRGMRVVMQAAHFAEALEAAKREALAAFGDDHVLLERQIARPRHIEFQVLADHQGNYVHLFERECSIQRRHQKILEETPSVALSDELRERMGQDAIRLAKAAKYHNAGTVEFMLDDEDNYYFLEMNTRLQVEHPITELVSSVDLVQFQIAIAAGAPLTFTQEDLRQQGHAIEVRVCAEDPYTFLPATGTIKQLRLPEGPYIRNDVGVQSGDQVSQFYDAMIGKLIVWGEDRTQALERLQGALQDYRVDGVTNNLPLLRALSAHPELWAGNTHTNFLETSGLLSASLDTPPPSNEFFLAAALADYLSIEQHNNPWQSGMWQLQQRNMRQRYGNNILVELNRDGNWWEVQVGESPFRAQVLDFALPHLVVQFDDFQIGNFTLKPQANGWQINWQNRSYLIERSPAITSNTIPQGQRSSEDGAQITAPMPGTIIKLLVEEGDLVEAQQPLAVLEAMKMEHVVAAPASGAVKSVKIALNAQVQKGAILLEIEGFNAE
jgi:3-methylcrotonyl-CoA carboxylase alpha subunit